MISCRENYHSADNFDHSVVMVPLKSGAPVALAMAILHNDGRDIEVALDGDGRADAKLIHTVNAVQSPGGGFGMRSPTIDIAKSFGPSSPGTVWIHVPAAK